MDDATERPLLPRVPEVGVHRVVRAAREPDVLAVVDRVDDRRGELRDLHRVAPGAHPATIDPTRVGHVVFVVPAVLLRPSQHSGNLIITLMFLEPQSRIRFMPVPALPWHDHARMRVLGGRVAWPLPAMILRFFGKARIALSLSCPR